MEQNIKSRCNGKIIIIDTGISHAYGGVLSALSIHYTLTPKSSSSPSSKNKNHKHKHDDDDEDKWVEREVVSALYVDRQEIIVTEEREIVGRFRHDHDYEERDDDDEEDDEDEEDEDD